jgi:hypothetical protein
MRRRGGKGGGGGKRKRGEERRGDRERERRTDSGMREVRLAEDVDDHGDHRSRVIGHLHSTVHHTCVGREGRGR